MIHALILQGGHGSQIRQADSRWRAENLITIRRQGGAHVDCIPSGVLMWCSYRQEKRGKLGLIYKKFFFYFCLSESEYFNFLCCNGFEWILVNFSSFKTAAQIVHQGLRTISTNNRNFSEIERFQPQFRQSIIRQVIYSTPFRFTHFLWSILFHFSSFMPKFLFKFNFLENASS